MTREELAEFDGRQGRKAYVAVNGQVFDVTASRYWIAGNHLDAHQAGSDLTAALEGAPHVRAVMERFPVVGVLEERAPAGPAGGMKRGAIVAGLILLGLLAWLLLR